MMEAMDNESGGELLIMIMIVNDVGGKGGKQ